MIETFEVRLPISDILVIKPVDHVFAQDQVRQERVGASGEEAGRNEIRPMDCRPPCSWPTSGCIALMCTY
jgi:hypothetical protein